MFTSTICMLKVDKKPFVFVRVCLCVCVRAQMQLSRKVKQGEKLIKECEATAVQCCHIFDRVMAMRRTSDKIKRYRQSQMERSQEAQKRKLTHLKKVGARNL